MPDMVGLSTNVQEMSAMSLGELEQSLNAYREETPHLWNLNEDPALSDVIVHFLEKGGTRGGHKRKIGRNLGQSADVGKILPKH